MKAQGQLFPAWVDKLNRILAVLIVGGLVYTVVLLSAATDPDSHMTGFQPEQPVPYSHAVHVGQLGIDCLYCHVGAETGAVATLPSTEICMNCHGTVLNDSEKLQPVFDSHESGLPVEWVRVHDLPQFVFFNHSAHVTRGVGCMSCHGRVDKMGESGVYQDQPLSMGWCLDCHKDPEPHLRPLSEITNMEWLAGDQDELGHQLMQDYNINPSTDCSTCHR